MEAFLPWLYARYIYPYQEERVLGSGYELDLSLMDGSLTPEERVNFNKSREFFSLQAFVLGLRTGIGLAESFQPRRAE
ncbi:hypothetical protein [Intestinimonas butyriciproducens]|uniref:hypothetical protein n=1 Tax=Intestinimonas butyriciproducens TaxID=1297617 RepID=UPI0019589EB3|nr:hypothetical protein [Intestinimonas butyriciproducens]MBM6977099.1 hypothetical protein [Intestinimonas butyriciproducens]